MAIVPAVYRQRGDVEQRSIPPGPFVSGYVYAPWIPSGSPAAQNSSRKIAQVVMNAKLKAASSRSTVPIPAFLTYR
jgi:hypothetical protein